MEGNQNENFKRETKVSGEPKNEEWNQKYRKGSKIKFLKETKKITKKFWHIWAIVLQICFYLFMTCFMLTFFIFLVFFICLFSKRSDGLCVWDEKCCANKKRFHVKIILAIKMWDIQKRKNYVVVTKKAVCQNQKRDD